MALGRKPQSAPMPPTPPKPLTKGERLRARAMRLRNLPRMIEPMQRRAVDPVSEALFFAAAEILDGLADALED